MLITHPSRLRRARTGRSGPVSLLQPGRNVWRATHADRAAVLSDGATYFGALRTAMLGARRTIHILGWDIDSRTRLVGEEEPTDGLPGTLGAFLSALTERNPDLTVRLLLWDYSVLYAMERELLPVLALRWNTPPRVELCLDGETPFGASHHQKVVVVDDRVAFCGGLDLTIRRWDTRAHDPDDPRRVDPAGKPYPPFHDVQSVVDGDAATHLAALFRARWLRASGEALTPTETDAAHDPWPAALPPDITDIRVGIARTRPAHRDQTPRREVETLYLDSIATAERHIYVENQFLTCGRIARAIIRRMRQRPALEAVFVAPKTHHTWLEHRTMLAGRIRFARLFRRAGVADRARFLHPHVTGRGTAREVMVHAKVMVVDDRLIRVGSSNLANRSMGLDTECDLILEARDESQRAAVARMRNRLIGEHLGLTAEEVGARITETGSLIATVERGGADGHELRPVKDGRRVVRDFFSRIERAADPRRPIAAGEALADYLGHPDSPPPSGRAGPLLFRVGVTLAIVGLVALLWKATPLATMGGAENLGAMLEGGGHWGPFAAFGLFLLLGFLAFPVNVLIVGTAAAFGTWPGLLYAGVGAMISAVATYGLGRWFGPDLLRRILGPRINRVAQVVNRNGIVAVTTVRLLPVAPFTLVNLMAGALRVRVVDYVVGTALGLLPGILMLSFAGDSLTQVLSDPSPRQIGILLGVVAAWAALTWGLQRIATRHRDRAARREDAAARS